MTTPVFSSSQVGDNSDNYPTFIHLCDIAWKLYDARKWTELDEHKKKCDECRKVPKNVVR